MNSTLESFLSYVFWPNPGNAHYGSPKAIALLLFCLALIVAAVIISFWRRGRNPMQKKLSRSWATACFWFGFTGLILVVSRVEQIQYVAMRFWWGVWILAAILYIWFQFKMFRTRYYEVLPVQTVDDPRSKYLPKRKK